MSLTSVMHVRPSILPTRPPYGTDHHPHDEEVMS